MPRYQDTGRCIGYAHLTVNSQEARDTALAKSGEKLKGRYLDIKEAQGSKSSLSKDQIKNIAESMPEECTTLFIKNLPYEFKEDDIGDRFRKFGEIKSIRIAYNWVSKQSKGFAYLSYANHSSAKKALLEMNGREVKGRQLKVDFDVVQEPKKGYKMNLSKEKNKTYNKEVQKEMGVKRKRKDNEKRKSGMDKAKKHSE